MTEEAFWDAISGESLSCDNLEEALALTQMYKDKMLRLYQRINDYMKTRDLDEDLYRPKNCPIANYAGVKKLDGYDLPFCEEILLMGQYAYDCFLEDPFSDLFYGWYSEQYDHQPYGGQTDPMVRFMKFTVSCHCMSG